MGEYMLEHNIINLLNRDKDKSFTITEISSYLGVNNDEIIETIKSLEENGIIFLNNNGKYHLVANSSLKKGIIKVTKRKGPIVVLTDGTEYDLICNSHGKVAHNDIVLVEPYRRSNLAQLFKVIKRVYTDYIGEVKEENNQHVVVFKDGQKPISISKKYIVGTKLLIDGKSGTIKSVVGHKDDPNIREKELLSVNGFSIGFTDEYLKELESIPSELSEEIILEEKKNGRLDMRSLPFVTIDGSDTKDFDDAVCFYNNRLFVAIADTTTIIKEGTVIDKETINRGISVYPPGAVEPMFHHFISNGICSLNPYEDRFVLSSITFPKESDGKLYCKLSPSIINSKMRMTYEDVNLFLEEGVIVKDYEKYRDMLTNLYNFAMYEKAKILKDGFLEFTSDEVKMAFEEEKVTQIRKRHHGKAEELIEFIMLYHNLEMTSEFIKRNLPYIARNHDNPDNDKITKWNKLVNQRNYKVEIKGIYSNEDIRNTLKAYSSAPERTVLDNIGIRAQAKAVYSAYNKGHFALGQRAYATFTSPIRRLSDYINQRIFMDALKYGNKYAREKWEPRMESLARIATDSEIRADEVERMAIKIKMAKYMANNYSKGTNFIGYIAYIGKDYFRVLLSDSMIYGKIYYNPNDWTISKDSFSIINNLDGEKLLIGDKITVTLKMVDLESSEIIFTKEKNKECYYEKEKKDKTKVKTR